MTSSFIAFINAVVQNTHLKPNNREYDESERVIYQNYLDPNKRQCWEFVEHSPQYGEVKVYKSVIILNKGIVITLCPNYKIRISQCDTDDNKCEVMLMDSDYKFIDLDMLLFPKYYSKLEPKIIDIYKLEGEINFLLMLLAPAF